MKKLTVVQLLPALESGGVERGTLEVGRYLVEHGHRSIVISAGGRLVSQLEAEGSEHVTWEIGRKSLLTPLRYVRRLRRLLRDEGVDILHVRSRMPAWVGWLAWKGMAPGRRPHLVTTVHGMYSVNAYSAVMTKGEVVIAVSQTVRRYILDNYPSTPEANIRVIPRGIDPATYPPGFRPSAAWLAAWQAEYPQLAGRRVLTLPGRITRLKGHEDFIALIARLKADGEPVHGLIVGGAETRKQPYLAELRAKVAQAGLANDITFTGQRGDLREIMAVSDLVLSLSTQPESFGRTVLEALSMGVPVIGYDHGGVGEQLALLYPQGRVALGDRDGLVRQCRATAHATRIQLNAAPPTLQDMLASTLAIYENVVPARTTNGISST
ncbi:MAG: glycosyltransferase family 4 protein [Pseudomonadota bacterium]